MKDLNKLSVAFYWHLHQPVYQLEDTFLMPYVRLHAVKDYLDMLLFLEKFPSLKLNFNIVPSLIDSILSYVEDGYTDVQQDLTLSDVDELTDDEKAFILNNFFTANYETMILKSERYTQLYKKRFRTQEANPEDFTSQDYSDLMALFNLAWVDSSHKSRYPEYRYLFDKREGFSLDDRRNIIRLHLKIMGDIIPAYKRFLDEGRIEITTSPYYHPILPVLQDIKAVLRDADTTEGLPPRFNMSLDAKKQIRSGLDRIEEVFGVRPKGLWPPELCLSNRTLNTLAQEGIEWTISDEAILSESIDFPFIRDFKSNLEDPYHLLKVYEFKDKYAPVDIIFRDRSLANLINFEYANIDNKMAARDLYDKIKSIQSKLLVSPDDTHLLTIALDGENCWERYDNDGTEFLDTIYSEIENDPSLETVLISDYIKQDRHKKELKKIYAGSWINNSFRYWIGDKEKNTAWASVKHVRDDVFAYKKEHRDIPKSLFDDAMNELYICQGSDWFWWYGEPNNSGQDYIFDYIFRERLKNIYKILGTNPPEYLETPFITTNDLGMKYPEALQTQVIDGRLSSDTNWSNAGSIIIPDGPVYQENKIFDKISFCNDTENIYLRIYTNKNSEKLSKKINQFHIYTRNASVITPRAPIRLIDKNEENSLIVKEKFNNELLLIIIKDELFPIRFLSVREENCWRLEGINNIEIKYEDVIDIKLPFADLGINSGDTLEMFFATSDNGIKDTYIPNDALLVLKRPAKIVTENDVRDIET